MLYVKLKGFISSMSLTACRMFLEGPSVKYEKVSYMGRNNEVSYSKQYFGNQKILKWHSVAIHLAKCF